MKTELEKWNDEINALLPEIEELEKRENKDGGETTVPL